MGHRVWMVGAVLVTLTGCSTGGTATPSLTTEPQPPTSAAPASTTPTSTAPATTVPTTAAPETTGVSAPDPLAFFRAQEAPCEAFAQQVGNPVVEPDRFSGATVVRDLGNGATQIDDGHGTRLVVVPRRGIVLPASGRTTDVMPPPYEFGCSEKVFVGASQD
jgi:hypothetical protein